MGDYGYGYYISYSQDKDLIYDGNIEENRKNHPYYKAHREDQSIYSLLSKNTVLKTLGIHLNGKSKVTG